MGNSIFGTVRDCGIAVELEQQINEPQHGGVLTDVCVTKAGEVFRSGDGWRIEVVPVEGRVYLSHIRFPTLQDVLVFSLLEYVGDESTLPDPATLKAAHESERAQEIDHALRDFDAQFDATFTLAEEETDAPEIHFEPGGNCCSVCERQLGTRQRLFLTNSLITRDGLPKMLCEPCFKSVRGHAEAVHAA